MSSKVGYGKPPVGTRFKKGQSGNPTGRPKGSRNLKTELALELQRTVRLVENGRTKEMTKQRALIRSALDRATQGNDVAFGQIIRLIQGLEIEPTVDKPTRDEDLEVLKVFLLQNSKSTGAP